MLNWQERLILWNQYEILKILKPEDAKSYEVDQRIVVDGIEQFYNQLHVGISKETVPVEVSSEVIDILDMYRGLHYSREKSGHAPKGFFAKFQGFDGNHEHPHFGVAQFLRHDQGKWEEQSAQPDNSHMTSLPTYRAMVARWKKLGDKRYEMTPDQIDAVIGRE